jgi:hypothetical protein
MVTGWRHSGKRQRGRCNEPGRVSMAAFSASAENLERASCPRGLRWLHCSTPFNVKFKTPRHVQRDKVNLRPCSSHQLFHTDTDGTRLAQTVTPGHGQTYRKLLGEARGADLCWLVGDSGHNCKGDRRIIRRLSGQLLT